MIKVRFIGAFLVLLFVGCSSVSGQFEVQNGPLKLYYPNGQVSSEGFVKEGKPEGFWRTYYTTGILKSEGKRTNFLLDSTWNFYNQSGELTEVINYQFGKRSGFTYKYSYDNPERPGQATLISSELYINDRREGNSFYYFPTGELQEIVYYSSGKKEGFAKEFNKDSVIITLKQYKDNYLISRERLNRVDREGRKVGTYKTFFDDGSVKQEQNYLEGELHGYFREYDKGGKILQTYRYERGAVVEEIDEEARELIDFKRSFDEQGRMIFSGGYREGVPIGIHRFFDTTGVVINAYTYNQAGEKISEGIIDEQGLKKGEWTDFFTSGEVRARGQYSRNRRSGNWTFYFRNGGVEQTGSFRNGRYNGLWTWYYKNGRIWREENYFNGREDGSSIEYDIQGNVIAKGDYINGEKDGPWIHVVGDHREEGNYILGLKQGEWIHYYPDGTMSFKGNYNQGLPDGRQIYYYPDGKVREEQYYASGVRERLWRKYNELGEVEIAIAYRNNIETRINGNRVRLPDPEIKVIQ